MGDVLVDMGTDDDIEGSALEREFRGVGGKELSVDFFRTLRIGQSLPVNIYTCNVFETRSHIIAHNAAGTSDIQNGQHMQRLMKIVGQNGQDLLCFLLAPFSAIDRNWKSLRVE
jgi:hypothetical protein